MQCSKFYSDQTQTKFTIRLIMKLIVNNKEELTEATSCSVLELLQRRNLAPRLIVVKVNGKMLKKSEFAGTWLKDGDNILILPLVAGG